MIAPSPNARPCRALVATMATLLRRVAIAGCLAALVLVAIAAVETHRLGAPQLASAEALSTAVVDRHGALLRAYTTDDGKWRLPLPADSVDPAYLRMLLAFEDRRFYRHWGVDPLSYLRITAELLHFRRLVSGGSTLTMQAARLLDGTHERSAIGKLRQIIRAVQLESRLTKREILELYLRLAPFGGNVEGVRAASLAYFGKEPRLLSHAEAALLVALPQSPNARRPDRYPHAARRARDKVLRHAATEGVITAIELARALRDPVPTERRTPPQLAAHLADDERAAHPGRLVIPTTLDAGMQASLESLARDHARSLGPGLSAAIIVVEHATGAIRARVGSAGFLDDSRQGAVDMATAVRSPGSTLKPLVYALAFDSGMAHPETLIEDRPSRFGTYVPKNFDHDWHGTVTIREALAKSLNIPAVKVLEAVGPQKLFGRMSAANIQPQLPANAEPSLAMALGGVGLRATELASLYSAVARGGAAVRISHDPQALAPSAETRIMSAVAAWYIRDILKNAPPPANARAGQIGYKTGTSYGYRDAWSAGFDGRHTVVAWVGRPDGTPVAGLNGRQYAAPLLFDAFHRIAEHRTPLARAPHGVLIARGVDLPPTLRRFQDGREDAVAGVREQPLSIAFPPDRSEIDAVPGDADAIVVRAEGGRLPFTWLLDGKPLPSDPASREVALDAVGRGFVKLSVIDAAGRSDRVTVRLK